MLSRVGFITLYALVSAYGLYRIKAATDPFSLGFLVGCFFYGSGFLMWLYILRTMPLSIAFPIAAGSLVIATQFFGAVFLKEPIVPSHVAGVALILVGVALVYVRS